VLQIVVIFLRELRRQEYVMDQVNDRLKRDALAIGSHGVLLGISRLLIFNVSGRKENEMQS
jgi:hypothetical protein